MAYQERAFKDDEEARIKIRAAIASSVGDERRAARILGISRRTLSRYITRLGLRDELRKLRAGRRRDPTHAGEVSGEYAPLVDAIKVARHRKFTA